MSTPFVVKMYIFGLLVSVFETTLRQGELNVSLNQSIVSLVIYQSSFMNCFDISVKMKYFM